MFRIWLVWCGLFYQVRGCLFVSGSGTHYDLIYPLYAMGVEIASHTVSHRSVTCGWDRVHLDVCFGGGGGGRGNVAGQ